MPLPVPRRGETHEAFIARCMRDPVMTREFPDAAQRRAVCEAQTRARARRALTLCAPVSDWRAAARDEEPPEGPRRFVMLAYSGGSMLLSGWEYPVVLDLVGLEIPDRPRPILREHSRYLVIGHTETITVQPAGLVVEGVISGAGPAAREVVEAALNGFPWQASVAVTVSETELVADGQPVRVNGRDFVGPLEVARRGRLDEISFVALGADEAASARVAAQAAMELAMAERDEAMSAAAPDGPGPVADDTMTDGPDVVQAMRAAAAAESRRIAEVRRICAGRHPEIEAQAIDEGWDAQRVELAVLRADRPTVDGHRRGLNTVSPAALEAALLMTYRVAPEDRVSKWYDARTMEAAQSRDLRGAGLVDLLHHVIRAAGAYARPGRIDDETIRTAFVADRQLAAAAGGFSSLSLPGILSNIANKAMLARLETIESVVPQIAYETDTSDFKPYARYRLDGSGSFTEVSPDGELKHVGLRESTYANQLKTHGGIIGLTRTMIVNDDLGAFLQIPQVFADLAIHAREEMVFRAILGNAGNFFSAANGNYIEGIDTALSIDSISTARQRFREQRGPGTKFVLVSPRVLLVPPALEALSRRLFTAEYVAETTAAGKPAPMVNPHQGLYTPVVTPYLSVASGLSGASDKAWYLLASPATGMAIVTVGYLRGQRTPTIESGETDFDTLGIRWRSYWDFGVALHEPRAGVKSKGEA